MAIKLKGTVAYMPQVDSISRKFVPRKQVVQRAGKEVGVVKLAENGWVGGGVRTVFRAGLGTTTKNYIQVRMNARESPLSQSELETRDLFRSAATGRNHIMKDLAQISRVQAMFFGGTVGQTTYAGVANDPTKSVNGIFGTGYTYRGWVFAVQFAGKKEDSQYDTNTFPSAYDA